MNYDLDEISLLKQSSLGKKAEYKNIYDSNLLFAIPRFAKRQEIGIKNDKECIFYGYDLWNCYEVSWLNIKGKPEVRIAEIYYSSKSISIVESKSLKLYLNSLNNSVFDNESQVQEIITKDLSSLLYINVNVTLKNMNQEYSIVKPLGICIDSIDILIQEASSPKADLLKTEDDNIVNETLHSNLLKSNCLVTGQPDWSTIEIQYSGNKICHASLLEYIISYRNHNEFHEQCVERIFMDIWHQCKPQYLSIYARYTRRGGIDINPFRSSAMMSDEIKLSWNNFFIKNTRFIRQ